MIECLEIDKYTYKTKNRRKNEPLVNSITMTSTNSSLMVVCRLKTARKILVYNQMSPVVKMF